MLYDLYCYSYDMCLDSIMSYDIDFNLNFSKKKIYVWFIGWNQPKTHTIKLKGEKLQNSTHWLRVGCAKICKMCQKKKSMTPLSCLLV